MRPTLPFLLLGALLTGCATEPPALLPVGQWSAPGANLYVAPAGTTLELLCRSAALPAELRLDDGGRFAIDTTVAEFGIIVTYYEATVLGEWHGGALTLTVRSRRAGSPEEVYRMERRSAPHLPLCG